MIPFFDLRRQYETIRSEIDNAIQKVIENGNFILNENVAKFEREFSDCCDTRYGIGVGSGTEALHLALLAINVDQGDEVIVPAHTFISTALAVTYTEAKPVFVDIEPDTYNIDPKQIESKITGKTKAIIPVHLYGHPADMAPIMELAKENDLNVIEDACQAHGALYHRKKVGSIGDIGCFSFYPTKNLGAYGDGGMIITNNEELAEKARMLRNYGQREKHNHDIIGYNSRLDEAQAAILRVKLKHLDSWNDKRRRVATIYGTGLSNLGLKLPVEKDKYKHVYHLYAIHCMNRNEVQKKLVDKGVSTQIHYPTLIPYQKCYSGLGYRTGNFPLAENVSEGILSLPMFPELDDNEVDFVIEAIQETLKGS